METSRRLTQALAGIPFHHYGENCDIRQTATRFYHWNPFRYAADFTHILALVLCLLVLCRDPDGLTGGVSFKSHVLFLIAFSARYINIFICRQFLYLIAYKVGFWLVTAIIVGVCISREAQQDRRDTCSVPLLVVPALIITFVFAEYHSWVEVLWIFSQHLEAFIMLPQYIYCYRDVQRRVCELPTLYVLALGSYRAIYGMNWLYKYFFQPSYIDMSSWVSGVFSVVFFADYLLFKACGGSALSRVTLSIDDGIRNAVAEINFLAIDGAQASPSSIHKPSTLGHRDGTELETVTSAA